MLFSSSVAPFFLLFFLPLHDSGGVGDRYNSARHTLKKVAAAATLKIACEILARSNIVSLILPPSASPGRHDDAKKKSPGRKRDAVRLGERPFCKRTGYS